MSQSQLARRLTELYDGNMEDWRRTVGRWARGETGTPKRASAERLAMALGKDVAYFRPEPGDESPVRRHLRELEAQAAVMTAALESVRTALESHDSLLADAASDRGALGTAIEELRSTIELRLDQLERRVDALEG